MAFNPGPRATHLVVDSSAFIERAKLDTYGMKCHTTQSVIDEIRDRNTRAFVNALPYPLSIDVPTPESLKWELARKTGDYFVLSKTDIEVVALTYQLYIEVTGDEPVVKEIKRPTFTDKLFRFKKPPELGNGSNSPKPILADEDFDVEAAMNELKHDLGQISQDPLPAADVGVTIDEVYSEESDFEDDGDDSSDCKPAEGEILKNVEPEEVVSESDWITSDNLAQKLKEGLGLGCLRLDDEVEISEDTPPVLVACLTKDFAIQNVLMNVGITLLALSGKIIREARTHVLWCGSCYAHTTKQNSYFCAICGYPNLRRIPVTLHEDGQLEFHFSRKFKKNLRGTKHPIIRPKGGKYADDPIYRADQRLPDRRAPKPKNPNVIPMGATNGLLFCDDEEEDGDGFLIDAAACGVDGGDLASLVFPVHDVTSKAATRGLRSDGQIVPAPWERVATGGEHGLKPTRYRANRPGRRRTGGKKHRLTNVSLVFVRRCSMIIDSSFWLDELDDVTDKDVITPF
ncbi:RNA binding protein NOB1 [Echinococcus multilocularis]|uniref:RNA binding protein NOB1 n=1 Tax=Echinococcus multilocularis TaxID=6211 RepID=A0A068YJW7_ECHMU|nr:RNA binding protein NOB1 [Echinococcus multilocularis]